MLNNSRYKKKRTKIYLENSLKFKRHNPRKISKRNKNKL